MTDLIPRHALRDLKWAMLDSPIVVLQGPRQVGKTTVFNQLAAENPNAIALSMDDPETLDAARFDPVSFVAQGDSHALFVDEAQRVPELILPLTANVDRDRRPGRFLLTGSRNVINSQSSDSLAGRVDTTTLLPLSQGEIARRETPEDFVSWVVGLGPGTVHHGTFSPLNVDQITAGGFPDAVTRSAARRSKWFENYIGSLATRDVAEVGPAQFADTFPRLMRVLAAQGSSELVKAKLARELEISPTTLTVYLQLLTELNLLVQIPAWTRNFRGRAVQRPKSMLIDSGLSAALAGFKNTSTNFLGGSKQLGLLVEQFVTLELLKQKGWSQERFALHHFRTRTGQEVDLVLELSDDRLIAIEIKATRSPRSHMAKNLLDFKQEFSDREVTTVLLYAGERSGTLGHGVHLMPISTLWEHPPTE